MRYSFSILLLLLLQAASAQVPSTYSNIHYDDKGKLYYQIGELRFYANESPPAYTLGQCLGQAVGRDSGLILEFPGFEGFITYGLIPYGQAPHPLPVFRYTKEVKGGKVFIEIVKDFKPPYDFTGWKNARQATLGYRLSNAKGALIFDGEISFTGTGPFEVLPSIYEGPFVSQPAPGGAVIWCNTTAPAEVTLRIDGNTYTSPAQTHHVWKAEGLKPATRYDYTVQYGPFSQSYHFRTAPEKGSREPFSFAYTSDSRHATGGGERTIYGANAYIMKKIAALAYRENAAFVQFTGDLVNGYLRHKEEIHLQYTNWKRAVEPFWHYMPFYVGIGNHEALGPQFPVPGEEYPIQVDGFPFATHSAEAAFAEAFVNPVNGPAPEGKDFPSYDENTYYYTYGNIAVIVLNSNYWYAPSLRREPETGGGLHGYLMDGQIEWLRGVIARLEADPDIDHIFTTQHTPIFPNGGHKGDDMWYNGNNDFRPWVSGEPLEYGIIERRDEYLDILINQSAKVVAVLTGDEHNYNRLEIKEGVVIHPENYTNQRPAISRSLFQINNGAAGAPYYGQEELPWSEHTKAFSVENALCIFHIDGKKVEMRVINPDTLNEIDRVVLRE